VTRGRQNQTPANANGSTTKDYDTCVNYHSRNFLRDETTSWIGWNMGVQSIKLTAKISKLFRQKVIPATRIFEFVVSR
jgi:hypothetical protein